MTAQFWLYYGLALLNCVLVLLFVQAVGSALLRAYRRSQVRKELR
jgi:ABC-type transport system involved in cytochrome c biogenesis permease component